MIDSETCFFDFHASNATLSPEIISYAYKIYVVLTMYVGTFFSQHMHAIFNFILQEALNLKIVIVFVQFYKQQFLWLQHALYNK